MDDLHRYFAANDNHEAPSEMKMRKSGSIGGPTSPKKSGLGQDPHHVPLRKVENEGTLLGLDQVILGGVVRTPPEKATEISSAKHIPLNHIEFLT